MRRPSVALLLLLAAWAASPAEEISVTASADAARIGENDTLTLAIEVRGNSLPSVAEPALTGLADFTIASGPSSSSSTQMVWDRGGATITSVRRYSWALLPKRRGTLTIPSFPVVVGAATHRTREITVEVVAGSAKREGGSGGLQQGPFGAVRPGRRGEPAGDVFVEAVLDRKEAYVGEQVLLTYRIYTQLELTSLPQPRQLPALTGFWVEEIPVDPRSTISRKILRGKEYAEITLMKKAIFATRSGELPIEETIFEIMVRAPETDDPFAGFFQNARPLYRRTTPLALKVLPLPEAGRPESFQGAVGSFRLSVSADRTEAQVNEAVGLKVEVEGDGNLKTLGDPVLPEIPDCRRFDPKVEEQKRAVGDRVEGTRTWSYVLVPLAAGDRTIAPVRFAYFDPAARAYKELSGPPLRIRVSRGSAIAGGAEAGGVRREVVAMRRDIRFIKPAGRLGKGAERFRGGALFWLLLVLPLAANTALYAHLRRKEHLSANVGLFRFRRASRAARQRLRRAREIAAARDNVAFYAEVDRAITGYVADKFGVAGAGLTRERILEMLAEKGVAADLRDAAISCLERCDFGRFAPGGASRSHVQALVRQAEDLISRLEGALG